MSQDQIKPLSTPPHKKIKGDQQINPCVYKHLGIIIVCIAQGMVLQNLGHTMKKSKNISLPNYISTQEDLNFGQTKYIQIKGDNFTDIGKKEGLKNF